MPTNYVDWFSLSGSEHKTWLTATTGSHIGNNWSKQTRRSHVVRFHCWQRLLLNWSSVTRVCSSFLSSSSFERQELTPSSPTAYSGTQPGMKYRTAPSPPKICVSRLAVTGTVSVTKKSQAYISSRARMHTLPRRLCKSQVFSFS